MKQLHDLCCLGVNPGQIRPFVEIAVNAGQRQVIWVVRAAVTSWADGLEVEDSQG